MRDGDRQTDRQTDRQCPSLKPPSHCVGRWLNKHTVQSSGMLSPRTGLGLEAPKIGLGLGLGLGGSGLGLETLWPRPRVIRPRGLVYCNMLIYNLSHCQFQLNIGNCYCKVSYVAFQEWQSCISLLLLLSILLFFIILCHLSLVVSISHIFCVCQQHAHLLLMHSGLGLGRGFVQFWSH